MKAIKNNCNNITKKGFSKFSKVGEITCVSTCIGKINYRLFMDLRRLSKNIHHKKESISNKGLIDDGAIQTNVYYRPISNIKGIKLGNKKEIRR